jgi:hypothetical protein
MPRFIERGDGVLKPLLIVLTTCGNLPIRSPKIPKLLLLAGVVKQVDALDSKSSGACSMRVRFPPPAPLLSEGLNGFRLAPFLFALYRYRARSGIKASDYFREQGANR